MSKSTKSKKVTEKSAENTTNNNAEMKEDVLEQMVNSILNNVDPDIDVGIESESSDFGENLANAIEEAEADEGMDLADEPANDVARKFPWTCERMTAGALIAQYKAGEIKIPKCQRLYVWSEKQKDELLTTIRQGLPFGDLTIGEVGGVKYLGDGYQRTVTMIQLSEDDTIPEAVKKEIMDYEVSVVTIKDMNWNAFNDYFRKRNCGTPLAKAVKERARLNDPATQAILDISAHPFFREGNFNSTFRKNQQQEIIAMTALIAAADFKTDCKAQRLADMISDNASKILQTKDKAKDVVNHIIEAFKEMPDDIVKRSFTATYINAWIYLALAHPEYTTEDIIDATCHIFAKHVAIFEYRQTTSGGSGSVKQLTARMKVIEKIVEANRQAKQ